MRTLRPLVLGLLVAASALAQSYMPGTQGPQSPDCVLSPATFTATGRSVAFDNRKSGCIEWTLFWTNTSGVGGFSVEIDTAADVFGTTGMWNAATASVGSVMAFKLLGLLHDLDQARGMARGMPVASSPDPAPAAGA